MLNARVRAAARVDHAVPGRPSLPSAMDWRKKGGNFVTPVKDQTFCGSCVAFGTIAVLESMVRIAGQAPGLAVDLSEAHLYFCYGPDRGALPCPDGGWWPDDSFACLKTGVVDEIGFPYTDDDQPCHLGPDATNRRTTASNFVVLDKVVDMKRHLATVGPLAACFTTYEDFVMFYKGGVYRYHEETSGEYVGGHCVAIIGYDDAKKMLDRQELLGHRLGRRRVLPDRLRRGRHRRQHVGDHRRGEVAVAQQPARGRGAGRPVRHATRPPKPAWTASTTVATPAAAGPFREVDTAGAGAELHVVGLAGKGGETNLWHNLRKASGEWQAGFANVPDAGADRTFSAVTCAAIGASLHVLGVDNGMLRHTIRTASGWRPNFTPLTIPAGEGALTAVGCRGRRRAAAGRGDRRRAVASAAQHVGTWSDCTKIVTPAAAGAFTAVSCAGFSGFLHVVGIGAKGGSSNLWHTIRKSDGSRQTSVGNIRMPAMTDRSPLPAARPLARICTCSAVNNGDVWHTMRYGRADLEVELGHAAGAGRPGCVRGRLGSGRAMTGPALRGTTIWT